jgi:3-hydroxybutyryl-CoA dehydratase
METLAAWSGCIAKGWPLVSATIQAGLDFERVRTIGDRRKASIMTAPKITYFEDLAVGQEASISNPVSDRDITAFAEVSGDRNPVHIDADYAATTMFKERIAHGMLSAAFISAVFGMKLPGPGAIYISQTLNFKAPVKIGDTVVTTVKIVELLPEKKRARFETVCVVNGKPVLVGEALLMVPSRSA